MKKARRRANDGRPENEELLLMKEYHVYERCQAMQDGDRAATRSQVSGLTYLLCQHIAGDGLDRHEVDLLLAQFGYSRTTAPARVRRLLRQVRQRRGSVSQEERQFSRAKRQSVVASPAV